MTFMDVIVIFSVCSLGALWAMFMVQEVVLDK